MSGSEVRESFDILLRRGISRSGLSLSRIADLLGGAGHHVSKATLSSWQSGRAVPRRHASFEMLAELEMVLGLEPGTLRDALPSATRAGSAAEGVPVPLQEQADALRALREEWGLAPDEGLTRRVILGRLTLEDELLRPFVRLTLTSLRDGADRLLVTWPGGDALAGPLALERAAGCRPGRQRTLLDGGLHAAELVLPHGLRHGQSWSVAIHGVAGRVDGLSRFEVVGQESSDLVVAQVVLAGTTLPARVRAVRGSLRDGRSTSQEWRAPAGRSVSSVVGATPFGRAAVEWQD